MTDASPFAGTSRVSSLANTDGFVTIVEGQTFALSGRTGDMTADLPHGLFVLDSRVLSTWELRVNGHPLEPLVVDAPDPFAATFVARANPPPGQADADLVVTRRRHVGDGMREAIAVTNHGLAAATVEVELTCDVDFADLFAVKEHRVPPRAPRAHDHRPGGFTFHRASALSDRRVHVALDPPAEVEPWSARWTVELGPRDRWEGCVEVRIDLGDTAVEPRFRCGGDDDAAAPRQRLDEWRARYPQVATDHDGLARVLARSRADLGALRIFDPEHPDLPILAAGAPWFMTVFGRDSLLTAWMTLMADPSLAHGVLETLARFQGTDAVPATEEEPGRILHEMRFAGSGSLALGGGEVYYGTIDATPLFVMLLGELLRWDPTDEIVDRLLPHADRALDWITDFGDRDGDGYVEYQRATPDGLTNQGWKDSWDAIRFADGRLAEGPIALCEVQGYVHAAYVARANIARRAGDADTAERWTARARALRRRFDEDFWLEEQGTYALALDGDKRPIDAVTSNPGHCLWSGIALEERAPAIADRLLGHELFSGFGVRTLATSMAAFNPVSYHNGSVWPHDNALCAAGLARYGMVEHAQRIVMAQLDVAAAGGGSLPELFAGFDRTELGVPAAYPTSCSPQAWAAASPLLWLRTLLRLDPWAVHDQLWLAPALPPGMRRLQVDGIRVAGRSLTVTVEDDTVEVAGAGDLQVVQRPRPPMTTDLEPA